MESNKRSIVKALTWRILASFATFLISLFLTGDVSAATSIAFVQVFVNLILYFLHERAWNNIGWERNV